MQNPKAPADATVFVKVDRNHKKITKLLSAAVQKNYTLNGGETVQSYTKKLGNRIKYLSFDGGNKYINFCHYELVTKQIVLNDEEFISWLEETE